ncbi:glycine receptor subunit alpha-3 [Folsomia candida]|uniref:Glutamate-gated chloride channel n=1 Tax=Folsomia candida TaxID=158441 RepID=A0A226EK79_FOLCA|nr:glycine receptor subunit alpha-3 [Folsomia candida]OXA57700.1 Glutamate-gated chloride channel [Folsomia candida]
MSHTFSNLLLIVSVFLSGTQAVPQAPIASICSFQWTPSSAYDIFKDLINTSGYHKDVRPINASAPFDPTTGATPTTVKVNFFVSTIESIDEVGGSFRVQLLFRQKWLDPRLAYENSFQYQNQCNNNRPSTLRIPDSMIDNVWTPDLYISQELDSKKHGLFHPNQFIKVTPKGNVNFSQRITLTLSCPQLAKSDVVKKECDMSVESYGHLQDELALDWTEEHPVYVEKDIFAPRKYKLDKLTNGRCDTTTSYGVYSCIKAKFHFSRN